MANSYYIPFSRKRRWLFLFYLFLLCVYEGFPKLENSMSRLI